MFCAGQISCEKTLLLVASMGYVSIKILTKKNPKFQNFCFKIGSSVKSKENSKHYLPAVS